MTKKDKAKAESVKLRAQVFRLHDQGVAAIDIATRLKIRVTSVAAFLAHRTRGSYAP